MDNRQFYPLKADKKQARGWIFFFALIAWIAIGIWYCSLGFGADPDAWLMAQTAENIRLGLGYDPARSAGNPVYELVLAGIQWGLSWYWSNLLNLLAALILLWRIPAYFPGMPPNQVAISRLVIMALPIFWEGATSSMETIFALLFWLETGYFVQHGKTRPAFLFLLLGSGCRPEYFLLSSLQHFSFWRNYKIPWALMLFVWVSYLCWTFGKNPPPFSGSNVIPFYRGQLGALIREGNALVYIAILGIGTARFSGFRNSQDRAWFFNMALFCIFPFEWSYVAPALIISITRIPANAKTVLLLGSIGLSFIHIQKGGLLSLSTPWSGRSSKMESYRLGQTVDFKTKTLLLYGATWIPTNVHAWEMSCQNRLFHRKHSNFYVGERLSGELDSLNRAGFEIVAWKEESWEFRDKRGRIRIPPYVRQINNIHHFLQEHSYPVH